VTGPTDKRVAVVTGGGGGIGSAIGARFSAMGWTVVLVDVDGEALAKKAEQLEAGPGAIVTMTADVSDAASVLALAERVIGDIGVPHLLCNNAGVTAYGYRTWEAPPSTWQWLWSVNVMGVVHGISAFLPAMLEAGRGHIVNTSSVAGLASVPWVAAYSATKHAVVALSESLRYELAEMGSPVRVSVLCPGLVTTGMARSSRLWPAQLGDPSALGPQADPYMARLAEARAGGTPAADVALAVERAVANDVFLILTDEDSAAQARVKRAGIFEPADEPTEYF
jgi:NAD(P)-dependent dehydrogenase (short-subunit alcohol dehydrogenase family)